MPRVVQGQVQDVKDILRGEIRWEVDVVQSRVDGLEAHLMEKLEDLSGSDVESVHT